MFLNSQAQLPLAKVTTRVNFREGPALSSPIKYSIDQSNLLVLLPDSSKNGFVEAFDVESSSFGFIYKSLVTVTDTLLGQQLSLGEKIDNTTEGDVNVVLINRFQSPLFIWLNGVWYQLQSRQRLSLVFDEALITYFSSTPGKFPVYGSVTLEMGNTYFWNFSN